jgi:hypothetical protein
MAMAGAPSSAARIIHALRPSSAKSLWQSYHGLNQITIQIWEKRKGRNGEGIFTNEGRGNFALPEAFAPTKGN